MNAKEDKPPSSKEMATDGGNRHLFTVSYFASQFLYSAHIQPARVQFQVLAMLGLADILQRSKLIVWLLD